MSEQTETTRYPSGRGLRQRGVIARGQCLAGAILVLVCWLVMPLAAHAVDGEAETTPPVVEIEAETTPSVAEAETETAPPEGEASAPADPAAEAAETVTEADADPEAAETVTEADADPEAAETVTEADADPDAAEIEDDADLDLADAGDDLDLGGIGDEDILFGDIPSVYGVSRFQQKITEAPSFVTLITSDEIDKYGYRTLSEALQSVTGFFGTYDRNYNYQGVRGFNRPGDYNTRLLVLVDGHRMNDNLYDQGGVGTEEVVDVDLIDRIEVIRGPSSSVYGTNAFFGVINVITKRGRDIQGVETSGELGSFNAWRARGTYGEKLSNGIEMLLSGSYYQSDGPEYLYYQEFDDPTTNNGVTRNADEDSFPSLFGKIAYRDFTVQGGFVSREKGIPTASYDTDFPTTRTRSTDEHAYVNLKYEHQFDSQLNLFGRVYYDKFYYQGDYLYDDVLNQDQSTGEWWGFETHVDQRIFDSHNVTGGIEFRHNFRQDLWNADRNPTTVYLDEERDSWNAALFLQDEWMILEELILNAGVRYDQYDTFGATVNPRIALIYNWDKTTFKGLYGTAFRGPTVYEGYYVGTGFKANPDLDPERISTWELVVEHALMPYIRVTGTGYFYRIKDLISEETDDDDLNWFQNRDEIDAMGLELQLEVDDRNPLGIAGKIGYALQQAKDSRSGDRLTNSPAHLVNFNVVVPLLRDKIFSAFDMQYASPRKTLGGDKTDHRVLTNLTLFSRSVIPGVEFTASVRNLFDLDYSDPGTGVQVQDQIAQDGRTFWMKAKYRF